MKPIPEDTGSFYVIRTAKPQMLYVDKTAYLHRLVTSSRKCLFLARPRRFVEGTVTAVGEGHSTPIQRI